MHSRDVADRITADQPISKNGIIAPAATPNVWRHSHKDQIDIFLFFFLRKYFSVAECTCAEKKSLQPQSKQTHRINFTTSSGKKRENWPISYRRVYYECSPLCWPSIQPRFKCWPHPSVIGRPPVARNTDKVELQAGGKEDEATLRYRRDSRSVLTIGIVQVYIV